MNIKYFAAAGMAATLLASSVAVQAQPQAAVTSRTTNLRAGPAQDFPVIAVLPPGIGITVQGCLPEYTWCDVVAGPSRGWMWAGNINYYYQNSYVPLNSYGPAIGIDYAEGVIDVGQKVGGDVGWRVVLALPRPPRVVPDDPPG